MAKRNIILFWGAVACTALLSGCSTDPDKDDQGIQYNREEMLANYGDNIILPAYELFKTETAQLSEAVNQFTANPTAQTLETARTNFKEAYLAWQNISVYHFGPAEEQLLRGNLNVYPTDTTQIKNNIATGSYNFNISVNVPAQGLPALDYLLFGRSSSNTIAQFTTASDAANRKKYVKDVTDLINQRAQATYTAWTATGGNYIKTFKESAGTSVGSSVGNLVNQLNQEIDLTKRFKVYVPLGGANYGDAALPTKTEAYFSGISLELLAQNVRAQKRIFQGQTTQSTDGPGLDDYLDHVEAKYNDKLLSKAITDQFDAVLAAIAAVPGTLSQAVVTNQQAVNNVYTEFQRLIVLTKTDMPQALGVTIAYQDNDGD